jgi:hypothetical protein
MPRKPINYKKVIIYKLVCNDLSVKDLYVGHTTDFTNRKKLHKSCCLNSSDSRHNFKVYKIMRENGSWYNWSMIEIEKYPCNDDNEARSRERHWYEVLNANMNSHCPTLDLEKKQQYEKLRNEKYYQQNKDNLNEKHQCECGSKYSTSHKLRHFKTLTHLKYIQDNIINEKKYCVCGGCFTSSNKSAHFKTKKHIKYIQENESE